MNTQTGALGDSMTCRRTRPEVLILTPVFNEEANLERYERIVRENLLSCESYTFRVLFIDDGSRDASWSRIMEISARDGRFRGIRLSRNFGSHAALSAGFAYDIAADAVCTLACDLQDPPEVILTFLAIWQEGAKIVWGKRKTRQDKSWRILVSNLFYRAIKRYAMPKSSKFTTGSFFLIDRKVAECYRLFHEQNRITFALVAWTGFDQEVVEYDRQMRTAGSSGWNFGKMIKAMYDTFIGFSFLPIRLMTATGVVVSILSFMIFGYVVQALIRGDPAPGWTSLMGLNTLFFGLLFLFLGLAGEYLYRIYAEVVRRPLYFVSEECGDRESDNDQA